MKVGHLMMGTADGRIEDLLDQVEQVEEAGFDAVWLAERRFRIARLQWPAPFQIAAHLAARTRRLRIGTAARIVPFTHPLRLAEEAATIDVLSGGRLDLGLTRAAQDDESHEVFGVPREETRGRFAEALAILRRAWTEEEFEFEGNYWRFPRLTVRPRPVQQPHPPLWVVACTPASVEFAAAQGLPIFLTAAETVEGLEAVVGQYRKAYQPVERRDGREGEAPAGREGEAPAEPGFPEEAGSAGASPSHSSTGCHAGAEAEEPALPVNRFVYVADSDRQALADMRGPFTQFLRDWAPDLEAMLARRHGGLVPDFEYLAERVCIFGSPETVAWRLRELCGRVGLRYLLCTLNYITLPHAQCQASLERFAAEVLPRLREDTR